MKKGESDLAADSRKPLWTKNFTILILGSIISIGGSAAMYNVFGYWILDLTQSPVYYSTLLAIGNVTGIVVPVFVAARLEYIPKEKVIYTLDFLAAGIFGLMALVVKWGNIDPKGLLLFCLAFQMINAIYNFSHMVFLPAVVDAENYSKAFSVNSLVQNCASVTFLVGLFGYKFFGVIPILIFSAVCFFIAALFEMKMKSPEVFLYQDRVRSKFLKQRIRNYKEVFSFIRKKEGIPELIFFYLMDGFRFGLFNAVLLPFFRYCAPRYEFLGFVIDPDYLFVIALSAYGIGSLGGSVTGILSGLSGQKEFYLFIILTLCDFIVSCIYVFLPLYCMVIVLFLMGFSVILSNALKDAAFYRAIPESMRSKFSGVQISLRTLFMVLGNYAGPVVISLFKDPGFGNFVMMIPCLILSLIFVVFRFKQMKHIFVFP